VIGPEVLGRALGEAPNPELARIAVSRIGERPEAREILERPEVIASAARLLGFSSAASDFFFSHPEELEALADVRSRTAGELMAEAHEDLEKLGPQAGLRRFRHRAAYRVAARDLGGAAVEDVVSELTGIAEACLSVALKAVGARDERVVVVGMGKLGGSELNYASDVDVIFSHAEAGGEAQERAADLAARSIALLTEPTADGVALRVDTNLRPEGRAGPLSRSVDSMVEYYERHAATWERQALLKARPVAGDKALGRRLLESVVPFVYPAVLPASAIEDVRASKARIEEHVRALGKEGSELKRGRGGIRDVEFAVQLLQLVHGRRDARLRDPNTIRALSALAGEGYVAGADAVAMADSYRFLRRLEHRLQIVRDTQTHELPSDLAAVGPLARAMGLTGPEHLRSEYVRHTENVRALHERLFYRPLLEAFAGSPVPHPGTDRQATEELLTALGFADPTGAYHSLAEMVDPQTRLGKVLGTLFPVIAPAIATASIPDVALVRLARITEALGHDEALAERTANLMADRPDGARRFTALVAASSAFSDLLTADPSLILAALEPPAAQTPLFPVDARAETVRVAGAYAAGELRVQDVGRRLSAVADGAIAQAVAAASSRVPFAVVGMGKLGAEELAFGSDLDLLVVYEGHGVTDFEAATESAGAVLGRLREGGWEPDPDLRPEGRSGPLARSMASYVEYWQRWAETWEFQALLRARFVAGNEPLGRRFLSNASDLAYPEALTVDQVITVRRMRVRMEEERVRPREARRFHFKLGYGSLADVQWAVELSLMRHGYAHPEVRRTNTLEALESLAAARLLEDSVVRSLADAHLFLMDVKNALEVDRRTPVDALPPAPEDQAALARRLGYGEQARHHFLQDYRRVTRAARLAMERVFYEED
jgi:[glutamine synthetase] adenylyltransferase / [glutamine synthetase]-adenylyl-L-tyrosine phosphorylase